MTRPVQPQMIFANTPGGSLRLLRKAPETAQTGSTAWGTRASISNFGLETCFDTVGNALENHFLDAPKVIRPVVVA